MMALRKSMPITEPDSSSIFLPSEDSKGRRGSGYVDSRKGAMAAESMMRLSEGTWWIAGTVYFCFSSGAIPLHGVESAVILVFVQAPSKVMI